MNIATKTVAKEEISAQKIKNLLDKYQQVEAQGPTHSLFVEYVNKDLCQYFFSPFGNVGKETATWEELDSVIPHI